MANRVVWKFPLIQFSPTGFTSGRPSIEMPQGAKPLTVQLQGDWPHLWALVDPAEPPTGRHFAIVGTGQPVPDDIKDYIGTWQQSGLVFHVFECHYEGDR